MFKNTRIKLTAWYLLIIMSISISFSTVIYKMVSFEIKRVADSQQQRLERQFFMRKFPPPPVIIDTEAINDLKARLLFRLIVINGSILLISGGLGYVLAGRTLKPIQDMLEEQKRFVSDSSHELRTPLTSLKTSMEVALMNKKLSVKEARQLIEENIKEVDSMKNLSDDLLTLAKLEGENNSDFERLDIKKITDLSVNRVNSIAISKKIQIKNLTKNGYIQGSKSKLTELFTILLDNAIKYSAENTTITLSSNKTNKHLIVKVKDQGIGISKKDIPNIFNRFYRSDLSRTKNETGGYGLGLSIADRIVSLHKGKISVKSSLGKGSEFIVSLLK